MKLMGEPDEAAFAAVYERHHGALLRYAVRRVRDDSQARDVVAETFEIAWRKRSQLPADSLPWLYRTASYVIATERRRAIRSADAHLALLTEQSAQHTDTAPQAATERLRRTLLALRSLSEDDQQILQLHAWEDLDGKALATVLGCSRTAAGVRLHRARKRLQRAVDRLTEDSSEAPSARSRTPHSTSAA